MAEQTKETKAKMEEGVVYIGIKPFMNYINAVTRQMNNGRKEVTLKSRGKSISRCVDIAESYAKKFSNGTVKVEKITSGSEDFTNKEGKQITISTIEIELKRV